MMFACCAARSLSAAADTRILALFNGWNAYHESNGRLGFSNLSVDSTGDMPDVLKMAA